MNPAYILLLVSIPAALVICFVAVDMYYARKELREQKKKEVRKIPPVVDVKLDYFEEKIS